MPMYGNHLQQFAYNFFENKNENMKFSFHENDMYSIKKTEEKLDKTIKLFDEIWMDMMYEGKNKIYYDKFALEHNEIKLLKESDYVLFDLDEYYIILSDGSYRNWLYEKELEIIKNELQNKKKYINKVINDYDIRCGIAIVQLILQ
jgi:hypothetical protein|tara:strand:+ start:281 stop:718 length:438 start_codon:yes stop_codon:yes gene_type:complete